MRPDDDLRAAAAPVELRREVLDGLGHVPLAHVPRQLLRTKHRAVVRLGVFDHAGVLRGVEEFFLRAGTGVARFFDGAALVQLDDPAPRFVDARGAEPAEETVAARVIRQVV